MPSDHDATASSPARAALPLGLLWATFAALDLWLWRDGHRPTFVGNGLPAQDYYLLQAVFVGPVLALGCAIWAAVASAVARWLGGEVRWGALFAGMAWAYAAPVVALYLIPDLVAYAGWGFSALAPTARVMAPLALVAMLTWATAVVRARAGVGTGRALVAVLAGFVVQAVVVATVVR